ncbi:uncharacterized protein [Palaemon carinicauda]|uniref:uncharacterized protein isoform X2 n=1 Tax=Palaemon carinicauda TaxID=392227 RepID=UPI0035B5DF12
MMNSSPPYSTRLEEIVRNSNNSKMDDESTDSIIYDSNILIKEDHPDLLTKKITNNKEEIASTMNKSDINSYITQTDDEYSLNANDPVTSMPSDLSSVRTQGDGSTDLLLDDSLKVILTSKDEEDEDAVDGRSIVSYILDRQEIINDKDDYDDGSSENSLEESHILQVLEDDGYDNPSANSFEVASISSGGERKFVMNKKALNQSSALIKSRKSEDLNPLVLTSQGDLDPASALNGIPVTPGHEGDAKSGRSGPPQRAITAGPAEHHTPNETLFLDASDSLSDEDSKEYSLKPEDISSKKVIVTSPFSVKSSFPSLPLSSVISLPLSKLPLGSPFVSFISNPILKEKNITDTNKMRDFSKLMTDSVQLAENDFNYGENTITAETRKTTDLYEINFDKSENQYVKDNSNNNKHSIDISKDGLSRIKQILYPLFPASHPEMRRRRSEEGDDQNNENTHSKHTSSGRLLSPLGSLVIEDDFQAHAPTQNSRGRFRVSLPLRRHQMERTMVKSNSSWNANSNATGLHQDESHERIENRSFTKSQRQIENLNPLKVQRPINPKPLISLITTSLARPEHRNIFRLNSSKLEKPKKEPVIHMLPQTPTYINGGPVDPAQLILLNSGAKPVAPGRPPSNVVAQPSAINPETLLMFTKSPVVDSTNLPHVDTAHFAHVHTRPVAVSQEEQFGFSPFFNGRPDQPSYIYTTARPRITPVDPANFLIASGQTTLPPITVPPPGFNPLLNILQRLDKVIYNENDINKSSVLVAETGVFQDSVQGFQTSENPPLNVISPQISSSDDKLDSDISLFPQILSIPGAVPVKSFSDGPLEGPDNAVTNIESSSPNLNISGDNSIATLFQDILRQFNANQTPLTPINSSPIHHVTSDDDNRQMDISNGVQLPSLNPIHDQHFHPGTLNFNPAPQSSENVQFPQNSNHESYPFNTRHGNHQQSQVQGSFSPHGSHFSSPPDLYPLYPTYTNHFGPNNQGSLISYPPFYPYLETFNPTIGQLGFNRLSHPSASVSSSVQNEIASANSTAEGAEEFISTSTTVVKGGTSTSNNNFFRVRPKNTPKPNAVAFPPLGNYFPYNPYLQPRPEYQLTPITRIPSPVNSLSLPNGIDEQEVRPEIIVDGLHNRTALPSDVFPGSQINVACSKKHGCPTFILRSRPSVPEPYENLKNVFVIDESIDERPTGNINIQCDYKEGCPTYIINTTPTPEAVSPAIITAERPVTVVESIKEDIPESATPDYLEVLQALDIIIAYLNQSDLHNMENNNVSLTGLFNTESIEGLNDILSNLPAPDINPQNIRPNFQILPIRSPVTTPNPLLQHISQQRYPNYDVLKVPENTVLRLPSLQDILDNRRHFQVNPILDNAQNTANKLLGQPGSSELLKDNLLKAHLSALQSSNTGTSPQDPFQGYTLQKGSLEDTHMGSIDVTKPPSLAAILNLEPLDIPNEPPLVPPETVPSQRNDHHDSMMRRIMGAAFVGLPITTALLGALGAPAAVMAPIGLALPALLTMGFMDADRGALGFLRHSHGHHHHGRRDIHSAQQSSSKSSYNEEFHINQHGRETPDSEDVSADPARDLTLLRSRPSLGDGGGIGGAIWRLGGLIPLLASKLVDQLGRVRKRRSAAEAQPAPSFPVLKQHHLNNIADLNLYYSGLTNGTKDKRPSPEDIKMHRKYLLDLLEVLRRPGVSVEEVETLTQAGHLVSSSSDISPPVGGGEMGSTGESPAVPLDDSMDSDSRVHFASRLGEVPSGNADFQTIGVEEAALLLHQFQTQGNINRLLPGFPRQQQNFQQQQVERMGVAAQSPHDINDVLLSSSRASNFGPTFFQPPASTGHLSAHHYSLLPSELSLPVSSNLRSANTREEVNKEAATSRFGQLQADVHPGGETSRPSSILHNLPKQTALLDRQNIPDLIEGLKASPTSPHKSQSSIKDLINKLPADFFLNSNLFSDHESLLNAIRLLQEYDSIQGANNQPAADSFMSHSPSLVDLTVADPGVAASSASQLYNQGYLQQGITALSPEVYPTRASQLATTRLTTELNTAFQNLVENITKAITTFLEDLATAISENPALLLLGLIPFGLLVLHLYHQYGVPFKNPGHKGGGYDSGGYNSGGQSSYGRLSFVGRSPHEDAESLAKRILANIDTFENWANTEFSKKSR